MNQHERRGKGSRDHRGSDRGDSPPEADLLGRVPPHDLEAEAAVLSAIILERDALDRVIETLIPDHFYSPAHRRVFEACLALAQESSPIDSVTVANWLRSRERLAEIGGVPFIARLLDAVPSVANVEAYARLVREKWRVRALISTCQKVAAEGYGDVGSVQGFVDNAEQAIYALARTAEKSSVSPLKEVIIGAFNKIQEASARGSRITGVPTGYSKIDELTSGLHEGDLIIVAARPAMGKTSFVLNLATNVASPTVINDESGAGPIECPGAGVCVFSLEMPKEQLATRMVCSEARVDVGKVRKGALTAEDWTNLTRGASFLSQIPVWIDDTPAATLLDVRSKVRRVQAEWARQTQPGETPRKMGLIVIDYLQLMKGRDGVNSREQEISEISRGLKQLAKELHVAVIALSQLNRSVEQRPDKRPQLSDLRESGAIEQDADMIMFIYRDEYYKPDSPLKGIAEIIIAKQRNGPTGKAAVRFINQYTRFDDLQPGEMPEGIPDE